MLPVFIAIIVLLLAIVGVAVWFIRKRSRLIAPVVSAGPVSGAGTAIVFRWRYIALPLFLLLVAAGMIVFFYARLPVEVAYHFEADGSADRWVSRGAIILWLLGGQLFLTLLAVIVVWGVAKISIFFRQAERTLVKPESVVTLMGNMVVLPQVILVFAMLDIFSYNSYRIHLLPLWIIAVIVMLLGAIIMGGLFIGVLRRSLAQQRQGRLQ